MAKTDSAFFKRTWDRVSTVLLSRICHGRTASGQVLMFEQLMTYLLEHGDRIT